MLCAKYFLIVLSGVLQFVRSDENIFCSDQFCQSYREKKGCPELAVACQIQNETLNGEVFPAPDACNCCDICMEHLKEGDYCTIGSTDSSPPTVMCGPGLYCKPIGGLDFTCQKMDNTNCFKEQIKYDELKEKNKVGVYMKRPQCDGDGNYAPIKCTPGQTCFCVDEAGNRLFGEAAHSTTVELTMKCECSLLNNKLTKFLDSRYPVMTARCLEDGSFDPMQCMADQCMCVEQNSGSSASDTYNVTEIGYTNMPCFNRSIHRKRVYLHDCEVLQEGIIEEFQAADAGNYSLIGIKTLVCQLDGWFIPVQENSTSKYCVDKYGRLIGDYITDIKSSDAKNMNCKCARTSQILEKNNIMNLPQCCPNGNFKKVQCRLGICFCVDENGLQISKEVLGSNVGSLSCKDEC